MPASHAIPIRAVLWDLDGTLYRQPPLRKRMLFELGKAALKQSPKKTLRMMRWLRCYRHVREELRDLGHADSPLESIQFHVPAQRLETPVQPLEDLVRYWMLEHPLPHLLKARYAGAEGLLERLQSKGIGLGVFSDYPVREKLKALELDRFFSVQLGATDETINAFKPHPRGFLEGCKALGWEPEEVVYVGDRDEVDGIGARAAGMRCLIISDKQTGPGFVRDFDEIGRRLGV
ncbi:MAG: HAD-IA family hydrolase [Planctomycetes bacterium]|nr:HAD-IA family hydrolase [Planctomycetota bacterium]